jgi:predicted nucleotidyltransferase
MSTKTGKTDGNENGRGAPPSNGRHVYWKWSENGKPDPKIVANIVERIVRAAKPRQIVLFGSAARGEMGPDSDYDFLVIKEGKFNRHRITLAITRALRGKAAPVDFVVVTPEEVERYRDTHCLVICPALQEGKLVYDSQALSGG